MNELTETDVNMRKIEGRPKPVTMEDMAKLAGVHSRTVADALKGTGRVAPATREKVLRIAKELNYVPNAAARALATGRTGTVAVLSGPLTDQYYANTVHLLETYLTAHSYEMLLLHTRREVQDLVNATKVSQVDGVIVIGLNYLSEEFLRLSGSVQPCVLIDTASPNYVDHITLDLRPAVEEALQLMLAAGNQRIAYVANNRDEASHVEVRMGTYLDVMKKAGRAPEVIDVNTKLTSEERIQGLKSYIQQNGCPDALLCHNDETAIHTYRALVGAGYRVPQDALLVGCDGLPYMEYFDTPLSTILLPMEEICEIASRFLQQRMATPDIPIQQATFQGRLEVRKSLSAD
ncbi:catabolite control protein A [Abditibacteriota bacterium]|nr:catabolite control protein A [Abditibacteriota bacterium]